MIVASAVTGRGIYASVMRERIAQRRILSEQWDIFASSGALHNFYKKISQPSDSIGREVKSDRRFTL